MPTHRPPLNQPYDPSAYGMQYAPPAPRNGLGITALILGLVAVPFLISGFTAPVSIVLGLIAIPLALVGLGRVRRHEATNRGTAIAGLVLGVAAVALGIAAIVVTVQAVGEVFNGPTATTVSGQQTVDQPAEVSGPISLGSAVDVDGLVVNVTEIVTRTEYSKRLTCANVSYENRGDDVASRNPYDWSARNPQGASVSPWIYTEKDALDSGDLAKGGTDGGIVCFDVPRDEVAVIEFKSNMFNDGPDVEWAVAK